LESTQTAQSLAVSGENLNAEVPTFLGETVIASLIVLSGYFAGKERQKRRDKKQQELLDMKAALEDFQSSYHKVRFALANERPFDAQVLSDFFGAKARVDTAADLLPDFKEAQVAKEQTSADMDRLLERIDKRRSEEEEYRRYEEERRNREERRDDEEEEGPDVPRAQ
jgi:hypothetical protein